MEQMDFIKEFDEIQTKEELITFWNQYMRYGWKNQDGTIYRGVGIYDKLEYVVSTNQECLKYAYYTCIEMVNLFTKKFMEQQKEVRNFCLMTPNYEKLHCFTVVKENDAYYTYKYGFFGFQLFQNKRLDALIYEKQVIDFMCSENLSSPDAIQVFEYNMFQPGTTYQELVKTLFQRGVIQKSKD